MSIRKHINQMSCIRWKIPMILTPVSWPLFSKHNNWGHANHAKTCSSHPRTQVWSLPLHWRQSVARQFPTKIIIKAKILIKWLYDLYILMKKSLVLFMMTTNVFDKPRTATGMDGTLPHCNFENLKPVEISKNCFDIIWTSLKVV